MNRAAVLAALLSGAPAIFPAQISTRCDSETIHYSSSVDVRRLGACSDEKPVDALWHLDRLDSGDGHLDGKFARVQAQALAYVVDIGVEKDHDEFADGNVIAGIDASLVPTVGCPQPAIHPCIQIPLVDTHGTGVASMIGGRRVGVAPGTSIVSVYTGGGGDADVFLKAFNAIIANAWDPNTPQVKTAVVNMSNQLSAAVGDEQRVKYAQLESKMRDMTNGVDRDGKPDPNGKRFLFTIAAGNAAAPSKPGANRGQCGPNYEVTLFPASLGPSISGVITVGGISKTNTMWSDTCRGDGVELFAPAEDIFAASNTGKDHYRLTASSGTSFAAPIVAGVAARLLTVNPDLTPQELESILESSPSAISDASPGPADGRVVFVPIIAHRRGVAH